MRRRSPASGRGLKAEIDVAGQDQHSGEECGQQHDKGGDEVTGDAGVSPEAIGQFGDRHEAETSLLMTVVLVMPLAICALGAGTAGWEHIAVSGGYWCVLFGISFWLWRRGVSRRETPFRALLVEGRLAIVVVGFAAVTFRSPVLLEIVPDILALAIAAAGVADGMAVGNWRGRVAQYRLAGRQDGADRQ